MKKLDPMALGMAAAVLWALAVLCLYLSARFFSYGIPCVQALNSIYIGARATMKGSVIAALWSLVDGFLCGYVLAALYNLFSRGK